MNRQFHGSQYTTCLQSNNDEGWIAVELHRSRAGQSVLVARVVFWDADGQFTCETLGREVPLIVLEDLIVEARATIRTA